MNFPALKGLRIGCVQYLNSKPLIAAYHGEVQFRHPSELARELAAGELDAGLVPIFEALGPRAYLAADDVAIACEGPVYSVFLAYTGELEDVSRITLDPASLTSVHLLKVLLAEFHELEPEYVTVEQGTEPSVEGANAQLLIGNQAIEFREKAGDSVQYLDLGEEWERQTGLPFVFAVWLLRVDLENPAAVAMDFRRLKREGMSHIPHIAQNAAPVPPALAFRYLTRHIKFDLGDREKEAIACFRELLLKHGYLDASCTELEFV